MKTKLSLLIGCISLFGIGCIKNPSEYLTPTSSLISQAKTYFETNIQGSEKNFNSYNYRSKQAKSILWSEATVKHLSSGDFVIVPVSYQNNLFISTKPLPGQVFNLSDLTSLIIMRDENNVLHSAVLTFIPDSASSEMAPSGFCLIEDWQGNTIYKPVPMGSQIQQSSQNGISDKNEKKVEYVQNIQVCNEIDGYNYSPVNPDNTYTWSETTCTTYGLSPEGLGSGSPTSYITNLALSRYKHPMVVVIRPPGNPIAKIGDYFKCFTNGTSPGHSYTVQVCVDQPEPGTRQAWGFTGGGPSGSSSAGNAINSGHAFLVLTENDQGNITTRNVGFYPTTMVVPTTSGAFSQGTLNNDQSHSYNISLTINVSSTQFFNILNYTALGNNQGFYYNLFTNNCTTFVIHALSAGGIALPSTTGIWPGGSGNDPGDLGEDIRNMSLSSNMSRNTVENPHPNVGSCN